MENSRTHDRVAETAASHGAVSSKFQNGVSTHVLHASVSLNTLRRILEAAPAHQANFFMGTLKETLIMSVNFNVKHKVSSATSAAPVASASKKRKRETDPDEDRVERAMRSIRRKAEKKDVLLSELQLEESGRVALSLARLNGLDGQRVVASWGLEWNGGEDNTKPKFVVSGRIAPGTAIPVAAFKSALGANVRDGMITTNDAASAAQKLPLGEHGKAAENLGAKSIFFFASVEAPTLTKSNGTT